MCLRALAGGPAAASDESSPETEDALEQRMQAGGMLIADAFSDLRTIAAVAEAFLKAFSTK